MSPGVGGVEHVVRVDGRLRRGGVGGGEAGRRRRPRAAARPARRWFSRVGQADGPRGGAARRRAAAAGARSGRAAGTSPPRASSASPWRPRCGGRWRPTASPASPAPAMPTRCGGWRRARTCRRGCSRRWRRRWPARAQGGAPPRTTRRAGTSARVLKRPTPWVAHMSVTQLVRNDTYAEALFDLFFFSHYKEC